jgi:hypothetical protein
MSEEMNNHNGMTPYEMLKVAEMNRRNKVSGVGVAGLVTGVAGVVIAGAGLLYAHSQAKKAQEVAAAKNDGLRDLVSTLATTVAAERNERIEGDRTLSISINDTVSGSQQGQLTANQQLSNEVTLGLMTGRYEERPRKVALYRDATPCPCPASGCGCNG